MKPITRKILNPNLKLTVDDTVYGYDDIIDSIDRAKTYFLSNSAKVGKKVLLLAPWPKYLSWFIAGAELGLVFVVADPDSPSYKDILELYGTIDFVIEDPVTEYKGYKDIFYSNSRDTLICTTSSGTTGKPKVIEYSHGFLYDVAKRNAEIYNLEENNRCVHTNTLTHSSVSGIYFLPTLMACANHYYFNNNFSSQLVKHKIQYCTVLRTHLAELYQNFDNNIDYDFTVFVISQLPIEYKQKLINDRVTLISVFGSSETMGPLLLSKITPENKFQQFNNNFGKQLDDFYTLAINDQSLLTVTMPDKSEIVTGDTMYFDQDNNFVFVRRDDCYTINNNRLLLSDFKLAVYTILKDDFDLVADEEENQIYIRVNKQIDLDNLNTVLCQQYNNQLYYISKQLVGDRELYMNDVKLDANLIRKKCRECN